VVVKPFHDGEDNFHTVIVLGNAIGVGLEAVFSFHDFTACIGLQSHDPIKDMFCYQ